MKRAVIAVLLCLCLLFSAAGTAEERNAVLLTETGEAGELRVCFFEEAPHVPYMGIREYMTRIMDTPMTMEKDENGVIVLKNERGGELRCDVAAGTISTPDWVRVIEPQLPLEGAAKGFKDSSCAFVRITEIACGDPARPVVFDLAKYGIRIHADDRDVCLPLSVLNNMLTDIATRHVRYDGKNLYLSRVDLNFSPDDPILAGDAMRTLLSESRPEDIVRQCYADLCFDFDCFFGFPGKAPLDEALAAKGLDRALADLGEEGAAVRAGLLSTDIREYLSAMQTLFNVWLGDGHTAATDIAAIVKSSSLNDGKLKSLLSEGFLSDATKNKNTMAQILHMAVIPQRDLLWGKDVYREYGSTAIIRLDTFVPDEAAWEAWYKGEGAFPEDCVGTVVSCLRRAQESGRIRNVIFDLSCNGGGSSDALMIILGLTTGRDFLSGRNRLTGQTFRVTFEADTNFDGVFDEKDREARFDFNYGVLTTRQAFSCGNLSPIVMRESGAVVIGEPTGGGSCCIQVGMESQGLRYLMSSCQWQLLDADGKDVEAGCTVDIPIEAKSFGLLDALIGTLGVDEGLPLFTGYFDDKYLNTLMNTWFHEPAELAPAA